MTIEELTAVDVCFNENTLRGIEHMRERKGVEEYSVSVKDDGELRTWNWTAKLNSMNFSSGLQFHVWCLRPGMLLVDRGGFSTGSSRRSKGRCCGPQAHIGWGAYAQDYTLLGIMPTNKYLNGIAVGQGDPTSRAMIKTWGRKHVVRVVLGMAAILIDSGVLAVRKPLRGPTHHFEHRRLNQYHCQGA